MTEKELLDELKEMKILKIDVNAYNAIRDVYNSDYGLNELSNLKRRIEYCIIYGEYLPAMLTINYLLEYFCKISLIYDYVRKNKKENITINSHPFAPTEELEVPTDLYDEKNLQNNIEKMKKENLINEEEFEKLIFFKEKFRNTLSHANRKKLYGNAEILIEAITVEDSQLVSKGTKFEKLYLLPFADFMILKKFVDGNCVDYFLELDKIIKSVVLKIIPKVNFNNIDSQAPDFKV